MRGIPFVAWALIAAACSSSTTNEAPNNSGGAAGTGGSASGGTSGTGGVGGSGNTSGVGGQSGSGGQGGSSGSGGAAGSGGGDAALGGSAGTDASFGGSAGSDASLGGTGGTGGTATGGASGAGGAGGAGGTGGTATGGSGGSAGSDAGDAATGGSAGDASADASDGAAGSDAGADAQSDAATDASDAASDAPVGDAGACPSGATGGDGTVHYPRWKIAGDARPDSEFTATQNVVLDHTTCLMWHRAAGAATDWSTAKASCESSALDGYTDWRLPTRAELISLTDFTRINPALNPTVFPGVSNSTMVGARFWSSTSLASDATKRWSVLHGSYGQMTYFVTTDAHAVRCVRGTGAPAGARFDTTTTGVVKDNETSLIWEASPPNQVYTLTDATTYCAALTLAGSSDWRVPTIRELATLPDPLLASPALPVAFTSVSTWYWSSTPTYNANPAQNWAVLIGPGFSQPDGASLPYGNTRIRCVR